MIFLPVTRPWSLAPVSRAIIASDAPRAITLLLDAPGCDAWADAFPGFFVTVHRTDNPAPPDGMEERRARHLTMRRLSQTMVRGYPRVLFLEDDTLIPPDTWSRLSACLGRGYGAASGVQMARHYDVSGVWKCRPNGRWLSFAPDGLAEADSVGHYCLMTSGDLYADTPIEPGQYEPVDRAHTRLMAPILVDGAVRCGHLLESGECIG